MPVTYSERDADTVEFFPSTIPFPKVSTDDYLRQAATDILTILREPEKTIPTLQYGSPTCNAYVQLAQILKRATTQPSPAVEPRVRPTEEIQRIVPSPRVRPTEDIQRIVPSPRVSDKISEAREKPLPIHTNPIK